MRKFVYSILLSSICNLALCQNKSFVINIDGTELMKEPKFNTDTLSILQVGTSFSFNRSTDITSKKKYKSNLEIDGVWTLVNSDNLEGYVVSSDISRIKPELININHEKKAQFLQLTIKLKNTTTALAHSLREKVPK